MIPYFVTNITLFSNILIVRDQVSQSCKQMVNYAYLYFNAYVFILDARK
jgi:hypothetical protein